MKAFIRGEVPESKSGEARLIFRISVLENKIRKLEMQAGETACMMQSLETKLNDVVLYLQASPASVP